MNIKSKEILYKSFIRDFNSSSEGINNFLTKENISLILYKMGYISESKLFDSQSNG